MDKLYTIKDIERLLDRSRTVALRYAQEKGWKIQKIKVGKTYKNFYLKDEVDKDLGLVLKEKKVATRTRAKKEAKNIDELPLWNQRVANSRYIICLGLQEEYEPCFEKQGDIIENFVKTVAEKYPTQMKILKRITVPTLRRWFKVFKENKDNPLALASSHGDNKGIRRVDPEVLELAKQLYFNKNKPQITVVWQKITEFYGKKVISYGTLRNFLNNDVNIIEKNKARMGAKEFKDKHTPHIVRDLHDVKAGDVWLSDGHDLDVICYTGRKKSNGERETARPVLVVWQDLKSRMIVGWNISYTETTESIAIALKRSIENYGVPGAIYSDNGKAYKSKVLKGDDEKELEGIYAGLGIHVTHALPYNAQAKEIERYFRDFRENLSKRFYSYVGENAVARPEHMKSFAGKKLAIGLIPEQQEVEAEIESYIKEKNHLFYAIRRAGGLKAHRGRGMENRTPLEVFNEEYPVESRKMLSEEKLRLLFLYEDVRTIQQNGIMFMGYTYEHEQLYFHQTEKVKIKYDPHDLQSLYVYLETGEFLCKANKLQEAGFNDITAIKRHKNRLKKINSLSSQILGIREKIRDDSGVIELKESENIIEAEAIEDKTSKETKKKVYIDKDLYVEIE